MTPTDSPLRFGPSSFRPTILLEDKYVAFAVSSDAARAAVAAAKRKDWKPSSELETGVRESAVEDGHAECERCEREPFVAAGQPARHAPDDDQHVDRPGQGPRSRRDGRPRRAGQLAGMAGPGRRR